MINLEDFEDFESQTDSNRPRRIKANYKPKISPWEVAASYFEKAAASLPDGDRASMFAAEIMGAIYKELLDQIPAIQFDVFRNRLTVPKSRRLRIAFSIWLKAKLQR